MRRMHCCYVLVAFLALTACQSRPATRASDEAAIAHVVQREVAAARINNSDSLADVFSSDT